jgi:hypothetical protein
VRLRLRTEGQQQTDVAPCGAQAAEELARRPAVQVERRLRQSMDADLDALGPEPYRLNPFHPFDPAEAFS